MYLLKLQKYWNEYLEYRENNPEETDEIIEIENKFDFLKIYQDVFCNNLFTENEKMYFNSYNKLKKRLNKELQQYLDEDINTWFLELHCVYWLLIQNNSNAVEKVENEYYKSYFVDLQRDWDTYVQKRKEYYDVSKVYKYFYEIYQKIKDHSDTYELVLGLWLLHSNDNDNENELIVKRHLFAAKLKIDLGVNSGCFIISTDNKDDCICVEYELFNALGINISRNIKDNITNALKDVEDNVSNYDQLSKTKDVIMNSLFSNWICVDDCQKNTTSLDKTEQKTVASFMPAIILRKQSTENIRTTATNIIKYIDDNKKMDCAFVEFVKDNASENKKTDGTTTDCTNDSTSSNKYSETDQTLYFPKACNIEQIRIVEKIKHNNCVVVQGPPGTGKSHTIANLICHFLATGKRVLVTAVKAQALQSLINLIPDELKDLTVAVLGNNANERNLLEKSVTAIMHTNEFWNANKKK